MGPNLQINLFMFIKGPGKMVNIYLSTAHTSHNPPKAHFIERLNIQRAN